MTITKKEIQIFYQCLIFSISEIEKRNKNPFTKEVDIALNNLLLQELKIIENKLFNFLVEEEESEQT